MTLQSQCSISNVNHGNKWRNSLNEQNFCYCKTCKFLRNFIMYILMFVDPYRQRFILNAVYFTSSQAEHNDVLHDTCKNKLH